MDMKDDRSVFDQREEPSFQKVIENGLLEMAEDYAKRAEEYSRMAQEYAKFTSSASSEALVVEDNLQNSDLVKGMLNKQGIGCTVVANAEDALKYCRNQTPMVILMDIDLPDMDGLSLTRQLRTMNSLRCVPIIAVTGQVSNSTMMQAMEAGCDNFIGKPFTRKYFVNIIKKHVESVL